MFPRICFFIALLLISSEGSSAPRSRGPRSPNSCEEIAGGERVKLPRITPVILKPLAVLFDNPGYQYEMKYDGFRGIGYFEKDRGCRFISRQGVTLSQFQTLCDGILRELDVESAILDGEVISPDAKGRPNFEKMLRREGPFQYVAFDLLWLNGEDLRSLSLETRREKLLQTLPERSRLITESLVQVGSGSKLYDLMVENDLEGIVVKRLGDRYSRSTKWFKYKNPKYSQAKGRRRFFR